MEIMTVVEGKIPAAKAKAFEKTYESLKNDPFPSGLLRSSLLRSAEHPEEYRIETVWKNREALEKMRSSTEIPKAVEIFMQFGSKPQVMIFEITRAFP